MDHVKAGNPVPFNPVRAADLAMELSQECSKAHWREAMASAKARWEAEGGLVVRVSSHGRRPSKLDNLPKFRVR